MTTDAQALEALNAVSRELSAEDARGDVARSVESVCEKYKKIRPMLLVGIELVQRIPLYGKQIADALRFLMTLADLVCPA